MNGPHAAHPYVPFGPFVVMVTRELFPKTTPHPRRDGTHFTLALPGSFYTLELAQEFIKRIRCTDDSGEYHVQVGG